MALPQAIFITMTGAEIQNAFALSIPQVGCKVASMHYRGQTVASAKTGVQYVIVAGNPVLPL